MILVAVQFNSNIKCEIAIIDPLETADSLQHPKTMDWLV